jgi:hypothetical protein
MIVLLVAAVFYLYIENRPLKISAENLARAYNENPGTANQKFLAKEIEISGIISSIYTFQDTINIVKFNTELETNIYCLFQGLQPDANKKYQINNKIIIAGECVGIKEFFNLTGVFVKVNSIKSVSY